MENKILEFVREFNTELENSNWQNYLQYQEDGFNKSIVLPRLRLFDDDNNSSEHLKSITLSSLFKQVDEIREVANLMLVDELDKFFAEKKIQMEEKFDLAKMSYFRLAYCKWKVSISGGYNEDLMEQFIENLVSDFNYVFEGLTLDYEY